MITKAHVPSTAITSTDLRYYAGAELFMDVAARKMSALRNSQPEKSFVKGKVLGLEI